MFEFVIEDLMTHPLIYALLATLGFLICQHVFFTCIRTRQKHKRLLEESRKDRVEMRKIMTLMKAGDGASSARTGT